eukprot:505258_1
MAHSDLQYHLRMAISCYYHACSVLDRESQFILCQQHMLANNEENDDVECSGVISMNELSLNLLCCLIGVMMVFLNPIDALQRWKSKLKQYESFESPMNHALNEE